MRIQRMVFTGIIAGMVFASPVIAQNVEKHNDENTNYKHRRALLKDATRRSQIYKNDSFLKLGEKGHVGGLIQFRYYGNRTKDGAGSEDFTHGFETARTQLWFEGNVGKVNFRTEGQFDSGSGTFILNQTYMNTDLGLVNFQVGQFILPFSRESLVDEQFQLAVDRSVVNDIFGPGYSQGVQLYFDRGNTHFYGAFSDGFETANTDFTSMSEADYAVTARIEWLFSGDWDQFSDFTANSDGMAILLGGAAHFQNGGSTGNTVDTEMLSYTADISLESGGWNVFASAVMRSTEGEVEDFDDFGYVAQTGYRLSEDNEIFGRFEGIMVDSARNLSQDDFQFVTVGWNHYLAGNSAKLTADIVYAMDETYELGDLSSLGILGDMDEGETAVRLQFQLVF